MPRTSNTSFMKESRSAVGIFAVASATSRMIAAIFNRVEFVDSLFPGGFDPRDRKQDELRRAINAQTVMTDVDSAGRVSLSKMSEKVHAMLGRDVVVVGNTDHFEVWNATTWDEKQDALTDEDFAALLFNE